MKAGIYVRISRDFAGESLGVQRQEEDCRALAAQLGWEIVELYVDNDRSALKARPSYELMLTDMRNGRIGAIVAWHPDRLYRRVTDLSSLVEACKAHNVQVATVNAGHIDLSTPTGRLVAGLLAQVAMYEVEHKSERWSRSWRQGREQGRPPRTGTRLFGYTREGELIPEEAALMRDAAARILAGDPIVQVLRDLEADGILTTRGNVWTSPNLQQYLTNPRVAGWSTMKREIVAEGGWEPILDRETFEAIGTLYASRSRPYAPRKSLLNGLIFCGLEECGHRLVTSQSKGKTLPDGTREKVRNYRCPSRPGMNGCGGVVVSAGPVEEMVEAYARERLKNPMVQEELDRLAERGPANAGELVALEDRLLELERALDEPGKSVTALVRSLDRTKARIEELRAQAPVVPAGIRTRTDWPEDLLRRVQLVTLVVRRVNVHRPVQASRLGFDGDRVEIIPR